jgi:hypothetical protein
MSVDNIEGFVAVGGPFGACARAFWEKEDVPVIPDCPDEWLDKGTKEGPLVRHLKEHCAATLDHMSETPMVHAPFDLTGMHAKSLAKMTCFLPHCQFIRPLARLSHTHQSREDLGSNPQEVRVLTVVP